MFCHNYNYRCSLLQHGDSMELGKSHKTDILLFLLFFYFAAFSISTSDARSTRVFEPNKKTNPQPLKQRLDLLDSTDPYFYYTPFATGSPPTNSESDPLNCIYPPPEYFSPPSALSPPSIPSPTFIFPPTPIFIFPTPPTKNPKPPEFGPSPPEYPPTTPDCAPIPDYSLPPPNYPLLPPDYSLSPPNYSDFPPDYSLSPPNYFLSPPETPKIPPDNPQTPPDNSQSPPIFLPPVIYPPPSGGERNGLWCVAKPSVPEPILQEAMNYACGSGADCQSILPSGSCFEPDSVIAHASYAFNSYWQRTRAAGGTCDFGGTAMLVTKDPSYDGCQFITIMLQGLGGNG